MLETALGLMIPPFAGWGLGLKPELCPAWEPNKNNVFVGSYGHPGSKYEG